MESVASFLFVLSWLSPLRALSTQLSSESLSKLSSEFRLDYFLDCSRDLLFVLVYFWTLFIVDSFDYIETAYRSE